MSGRWRSCSDAQINEISASRRSSSSSGNRRKGVLFQDTSTMLIVWEKMISHPFSEERKSFGPDVPIWVIMIGIIISFIWIRATILRYYELLCINLINYVWNFNGVIAKTAFRVRDVFSVVLTSLQCVFSIRMEWKYWKFKYENKDVYFRWTSISITSHEFPERLWAISESCDAFAKFQRHIRLD